MATDFPPALVDLQRRVHAAWDAVEAHRLAVDALRLEEAEPDADRPKWSPARRPWTDEESARHEELMAAALDAAQARRRALAESGLGDSYDVVQDLHAAARAM
jgi:hypothetical protein